MGAINIAFVDDERPVLDSILNDITKFIPALSKKYDYDINVEGCSSGRECIDFLNDCDRYGEDLACIVTDVRMPEMTGDVLLRKLKETHPKAGKIILTGFADLEANLNSVRQELDLVKYLKKPYDPETLAKAVDSALDFFFRARSPVINMGGITYKEVETRHELEAAFRLAYDVYVAELKRFDENKLTVEQRQKKQKFDQWDFRADTRQIVAMKNGEAIGRVRIIYNDLPLELDFSIPTKFQKGTTKTEISKFMIRKAYRGTGSYLGLLRFVYHHVKDCGDTYISNLPILDKFYGKIGYRKIGEFFNSELNSTYSAMYGYVPDFNNTPEVLREYGMDPLFRKMIMTPVPKNKIEDFFLQHKSTAVAILHKLGLTGEY